MPPNALILLFTFNVSLKEWRDSGMLARELALYQALLPHYRRILLITFGKGDEQPLLAPTLSPDEQSRFTVISNTKSLPNKDYVAKLPALVRAALSDTRTVVIKTNQMNGGDIAVPIAAELRASGRHVALIARGGYHHSRFIAHEQGLNTPAYTTALTREQTLLHNADLIVGTTQEMLDALTSEHQLDTQRTTVIPNYVLPSFALSPVAPLSSPPRDPTTFLYAGQLIPRKRVDLLIEAFTAWRNASRLPWSIVGPARLNIIGDGSALESLRNLATSLAAPVFFSKRLPHDQLMDEMRRCTAYTQLSELEGHPKTIIEAMSTGAPVLVADAPGLELIQDRITGRKVPPTVPAISAALEELIAFPAFRQRLGATAAHTALATYGLPAIVNLELEAHAKALKNAAANAAALCPEGAFVCSHGWSESSSGARGQHPHNITAPKGRTTSSSDPSRTS